MSATKTILKTKPAQIPWLGEIPQKWEVRRLKMLSNIKRGASPRPIDDPKYFDDNGEFAWVRISDVTASDTYLKKTDQQLSELGASLSVKQYPGDLFLSIAGTVGKPIFAKIKCCIHDGFVTFSNLNSAVNRMFLFYILNSGHAYFGLGKEGSQLNLNIDTVGNISIPLPPLHTQTAIVEFLDEKTAKISEFIKNKKELIELLKEQKKSLIYEAVTGKMRVNKTPVNFVDSPLKRGNEEQNYTNLPLTKGSKTKSSGVSWLGEIPEVWKVWKVSRIFNQIGSGTTPNTGNRNYYENGTIKWVNTGDLNDSFLEDCEKLITELAVKENTTLRTYPKNSLIIALYGATIGKLGILSFEATVNQACCVLSQSSVAEIKFIFYWFLVNKEHIVNMAYGGGQPNISQDLVKSLKIPLPPLTTQTSIVEFLDEKTTKIDETIATIEQEIELVEEYKKSLIYQVVTGKIEINNNE